MNRRARRTWIVAGICAACTIVVVAMFWRGFVPLTEAELFAQDWRIRLGRKTPPNPNLVLIGIDRPSYADEIRSEEAQSAPVLQLMRGTFPWSREVWAVLIERLAEAGARAIVLDFVFSAAGEGDDRLRDVLDKYRDRVVIGYNLDDATTEERGGFWQLNLPHSSLLPGTTEEVLQDTRAGFINIWADTDGILRSARYRMTGDQAHDVAAPDVVLESLAARALRQMGSASLVPEELEALIFRYTFDARGVWFEPHPIGNVLAPRTWERNYNSGEFFRNKVVLVGPTANIFQDVHRVPFPDESGDMPGPEIHLNILNAALHREFLTELSLTADMFITAVAGLVAAGFSFIVRLPLRRIGVVLALALGYVVLSQLMFDRASVILPVAGPLLVLLTASMSVLSYDFVLEQLEKARVRRTLERYVSKDVVKELLDNPQTYFNSLGGVRRPVAVLFSDVRGFTTMTENADSALLVKQLNEYFEEMVRHVFSHHGTLDKFIGDAVMAVWGNIVSQGPEQDAQNAVATALAMRKSLARLNTNWKQRGMPELAFGIGLNYGEVIVGNLGSSEKMELTVIGDPVNLASRLESLTKEYHLDLLLGENLAKLVGQKYLLRTIDCVQVKGKTRPVDVFTVVGDGAAQTTSLPVWLARYEVGVRLYRQREFQPAVAVFEECLQRQPDDFLCGMYLDRCRDLVANPPDTTWTAASVMTKK